MKKIIYLVCMLALLVGCQPNKVEQSQGETINLQLEETEVTCLCTSPKGSTYIGFRFCYSGLELEELLKDDYFRETQYPYLKYDC